MAALVEVRDVSEIFHGFIRSTTRRNGRCPINEEIGLRAVKVAEILEWLKEDGWYLAATRGSHRQYRHATKLGRVTVAGKPSDNLPPGTLNSILKQAGLKR